MPKARYYNDGTEWKNFDDGSVIPYGGSAPPSTLPKMGFYSGAFADQSTFDMFGGWPDIASTYYQGNQTALNSANEQIRINRGIDVLSTITVNGSNKGGGVAYTWADVGSGAADAWLDAYISALNSLQTYAAAHGQQVYANFEVEPETKINQNKVVGASLATYWPAWDRFASRCKANAPGVKTAIWFGTFDHTSIAYIGSRVNMANIDVVLYDPYSTKSHSASELWPATIQGTLQWLRAQSWMPAGKPIGIGENASDLSHGDSSVRNWYTSTYREMLRANNLLFAIIFNRNSSSYSYEVAGPDVASGTNPLAQAALTASLAEGR